MIFAASWPSDSPHEGAGLAHDRVVASPTAVLEPVQARHAQGLAELFERNNTPAVSHSFDPFPLTTDEARRIALEPRLDCYFVARLKSELIAMSMLRGFDEGFAMPSFGIFVDHRYHGQGVGRRLTTWTLGEAQSRGCTAIRLTVYASNAPALRLYHSLGFQELDRAGVPRATGQDEKIVMTRSLRG